MRRVGTSAILAVVAFCCAAPVSAQSGGESTYKTTCAVCHGADGLADTPAGRSMQVPPVDSKEFKRFSEAEMVASTSAGKGKMPAYKDKLSDEQIRDVVAYLRSLEKK